MLEHAFVKTRLWTANQNDINKHETFGYLQGTVWIIRANKRLNNDIGNTVDSIWRIVFSFFFYYKNPVCKNYILKPIFTR